MKSMKQHNPFQRFLITTSEYKMNRRFWSFRKCPSMTQAYSQWSLKMQVWNSKISFKDSWMVWAMSQKRTFKPIKQRFKGTDITRLIKITMMRQRSSKLLINWMLGKSPKRLIIFQLMRTSRNLSRKSSQRIKWKARMLPQVLPNNSINYRSTRMACDQNCLSK